MVKEKLIQETVLSLAVGVTNLLKKTRPGQYQEIVQDEKGTHILSTKDLCLVKTLERYD